MPVVIDRLALGRLLVLALRRLGHAVFGASGTPIELSWRRRRVFWLLVEREAGWLLVQLG